MLCKIYIIEELNKLQTCSMIKSDTQLRKNLNYIEVKQLVEIFLKNKDEILLH